MLCISANKKNGISHITSQQASKKNVFFSLASSQPPSAQVPRIAQACTLSWTRHHMFQAWNAGTANLRVSTQSEKWCIGVSIESYNTWCSKLIVWRNSWWFLRRNPGLVVGANCMDSPVLGSSASEMRCQEEFDLLIFQTRTKSSHEIQINRIMIEFWLNCATRLSKPASSQALSRARAGAQASRELVSGMEFETSAHDPTGKP